jgi:hypothetical protein
VLIDLAASSEIEPRMRIPLIAWICLLSLPLSAADKIATAVYVGNMSDVTWSGLRDQVRMSLYPDGTATIVGTILHGAGTINLRWRHGQANAGTGRSRTILPGVIFTDLRGDCWHMQFQRNQQGLYGHDHGFAAALERVTDNPDAPYVGSTIDATEENTFKD